MHGAEDEQPPLGRPRLSPAAAGIAVAAAGVLVALAYLALERDDLARRQAANEVLIVVLSAAAGLAPSVRPRGLSAALVVASSSGLVAVAIAGGSLVLGPLGFVGLTAGLRQAPLLDEQMDDQGRAWALLLVALGSVVGVIALQAVLR